MALLYVKYKNLLIAIIMHGSYNALLLINNWLLLNKGDWLLSYSNEWAVPSLTITAIVTVISGLWLGRFVKRNADSFKDLTFNSEGGTPK